MRDQSDMCFITFVTNHGVESAPNALIPKVTNIDFLESIKHLSMF